MNIELTQTTTYQTYHSMSATNQVLVQIRKQVFPINDNFSVWFNQEYFSSPKGPKDLFKVAFNLLKALEANGQLNAAMKVQLESLIV